MNEFLSEYISENPSVFDDLLPALVSGYDNNSGQQIYESFTVAGIIGFSDQVKMEYLTVSDAFYNFMESKTGGLYSAAISYLPDDRNLIRSIVEFNYDESGDVVYTLQNEVANMLSQINFLIEGMAQVFFWVGLVFAIFAALLLMNFIGTSVAYKKREIGILRAVGARSNDVFAIFFNESMIIACINFLVALIMSVVVVIFLNNMMRNEYGVVITILNFGIRQIALMMGISVLVAFVSSFLPVKKIASMKPIDAIKNR